MDEGTALSEDFVFLYPNDSNESDSSSSDLYPEITSAVYHQEPQLKTSNEKKDRRRKAGPVKYTTSLQRRKKAELRILTEEARQLSAQLERLQLSRLSHLGMVPVLTPQDGSPSVWRSLAMIESEGRERAERTNRELKAIMASHMKVHAAIQKILRRSNLIEGMDFVFESNPTLDRPLHQLDFSDSILAELSNNLGNLRSQTGMVLPALKADLSISCTSRCKYHELAGKCIESTSTTPMVCSVQKAAGILWHHITTKKNKDTQKAFRFIRTRNNNTLERNCKALLPDGTNSFVSLDGVNIIRKYEEPNRVVLVGTTTWFLPTGGLQFEDHHWTIISPSPTDPLHACVVQSCYQLQVKRVDTASVLPLDFAHVEKVVLNSIGGKLRNVLQLQQKVLLGNVDFTSVGEDFGNGTGKC